MGGRRRNASNPEVFFDRETCRLFQIKSLIQNRQHALRHFMRGDHRRGMVGADDMIARAAPARRNRDNIRISPDDGKWSGG